jgi:hypothetical protein
MIVARFPFEGSNDTEIEKNIKAFKFVIPSKSDLTKYRNLRLANH